MKHREIKFKFWMPVRSKATKREWAMSQVYTLEELGKLGPTALEGSTPLQFTGLKDKNGVEIYEGDILKGGVWLYFEVEWDSGDNGWNITSYGLSHGDFKIIGNIYENPEIIER